MKQLILFAMLFLFACAPTAKAPSGIWVVDPVKVPYDQYVLDKALCQQYAEAAFPISENEIKMRPYFSYRKKLQLTYYLDCMQKRGCWIYFIETDNSYIYPMRTGIYNNFSLIEK